MPIDSGGVPTEVTNFTWSAFFGLVIAVINGSALGYWIKTRPNMKKLEVDADQRVREELIDAEKRLREDLAARVEKLERTLEAERLRHDAERARYDAEKAASRHQLANVTQCLDGLLMLLEQSPDRAADAVALIKEMRARQREAEALEKAAIHAAEIAAKCPGAME